MLARTIVAKSVPRVFAARYSTKSTEGAVAQSKQFGTKEKAHEDEYIHRHEVEQLAKLKKQIEKKKKELTELEQQRKGIEHGKVE